MQYLDEYDKDESRIIELNKRQEEYPIKPQFNNIFAKDDHDKVIIIFEDKRNREEHKITILELIESGIPIDPENGDDMEYKRTELTSDSYS